jgi:hypothetical protein
MRLGPFPLLLAMTNRVARSSIFVFDNKDSIRVGVIQKNNASKTLFGTCAEKGVGRQIRISHLAERPHFGTLPGFQRSPDHGRVPY